ncbi:MAG: hypothetical protein WD024_03405 [Bacillota bacterium]
MWVGGTTGILSRFELSFARRASDQYCWDDETRATADVEQAYARIVKECRFDADRVILGGASQGGRLAILAALRGESVRSRGFIVVVPIVDVSSSRTRLGVYAGHGAWHENVRDIYEDLAGPGAPARYEQFISNTSPSVVERIAREEGIQLPSYESLPMQNAEYWYGGANGEWTISARRR